MPSHCLTAWREAAGQLFLRSQLGLRTNHSNRGRILQPHQLCHIECRAGRRPVIAPRQVRAVSDLVGVLVGGGYTAATGLGAADINYRLDAFQLSLVEATPRGPARLAAGYGHAARP